MKVLQVSGGSGTANQETLENLPISGDILYFALLHNRSTPRNVTGMTGAGATWTALNGTSSQRLYVYRGTGANATGAVIMSLSGAFTGNPVLIHVRPTYPGEDLTLISFSLIENQTTGTTLTGPVDPAHRGQLVVAKALGANNMILSMPEDGRYVWSNEVSGFAENAYAAPWHPEDLDYGVSLSCDSGSYRGIAQLVIGGPVAPPEPLRFYMPSWVSPAAPVSPVEPSFIDGTSSERKLSRRELNINNSLGDNTRDQSVGGNFDREDRQYQSDPILSAGTYAGKFRSVVLASQADVNDNMFLNAVVRIFDSTGTVERGVLYPGQGGHTPSPSSSDSKYEFAATLKSRTLEKDMTPVIAQKGDIFVYDFIHSADGPGTSLHRAFFRWGAPTGSVDDMTFSVDNTETTKRPWFEFDLIDPPDVPISLVVDPTGTTSIEANWSAPVGWGVATGYKIRLDGGAWTDIGNVLTYPFTGLTPATLYVVDVLAYNDAGESPFATDDATTDTAPTLIPVYSAFDGTTEVKQKLSDGSWASLYIKGQ